MPGILDCNEIQTLHVSALMSFDVLDEQFSQLFSSRALVRKILGHQKIIIEKKRFVTPQLPLNDFNFLGSFVIKT